MNQRHKCSICLLLWMYRISYLITFTESQQCRLMNGRRYYSDLFLTFRYIAIRLRTYVFRAYFFYVHTTYKPPPLCFNGIQRCCSFVVELSSLNVPFFPSFQREQQGQTRTVRQDLRHPGFHLNKTRESCSFCINPSTGGSSV